MLVDVLLCSTGFERYSDPEGCEKFSAGILLVGLAIVPVF